MKPEPTTGKKEGRIARHVRVAKQIRHDPKSVVSLLRGWLLGLWQARGGGFYGLGFVMTFIILEIKMLAGDFGGDGSVADVILQETLEYMFKLGWQSFLNGFLALLWPVYLLDWLNWWGCVVLIGGYIGFERGLRPLVEIWFPELEEARIRKEFEKREKKERSNK